MSLAIRLISELQKIVAETAESWPGFCFPEMYNTFDYVAGENRVCHQRTLWLIGKAAWNLQEVTMVEWEEKFGLGHGRDRWQPDLKLRDSANRIRLFVDFESPNSSDSRIISRNVTQFARWMKHYNQKPEYLIVTSLPDSLSARWQLRWCGPGEYNLRHKGKILHVRRNPFQYWYSIYKRHAKIWRKLPITFANFNGIKVKVVHLDIPALRRRPGLQAFNA